MPPKYAKNKCKGGGEEGKKGRMRENGKGSESLYRYKANFRFSLLSFLFSPQPPLFPPPAAAIN